MFGCPYLLLSVAFGFEVLPAVFPFPYTNGKTARPLPKEEEMKLTIFAAIGGIGRQALDQAVAAGPRRHGSRTEPEEARHDGSRHGAEEEKYGLCASIRKESILTLARPWSWPCLQSPVRTRLSPGIGVRIETV